MDEASADLFGTLAASVGATSWLVCVTRRDVETGFVGAADGTRVELGPLHDDQATRLAELATHEAPLPAHDLDQLVGPLRRQPPLPAGAPGGGHGRGRRWTCSRIRSRRWWRPVSTAWPRRTDTSCVGCRSWASRPPSTWSARWSMALPDRGDPVWARLADFITWEDDATFRFRNRLLRDTAYDGLSVPGPPPTAQPGRGLDHGGHRPAAGRPARDPVLPLPPRPALLRGVVLRPRGGRVGQVRLRQLRSRRPLRAGPGRRTSTDPPRPGRSGPGLRGPRRRPQPHRKLCRGRPRLSGRPAHRRRRAGGRRPADAEAGPRPGLAGPVRQRHAVDHQGARVLDQVDGEEAARQRAELLSWYGRFCQEAGHQRRAITWCTRAVAEAEAAGEQVALAEALRVIDWARRSSANSTSR